MQSLEKIGTVGSLVAAASCPFCLPALGSLGSVLGLGILAPLEGTLMVYGIPTMTLLAGIGAVLSYRKHKDIKSLVTMLLGVFIVAIGLYISFTTWILYPGFALLAVASVLNYKASNKYKCSDNACLVSVITCPHCGNRKSEKMTINSCQVVYNCKQCKKQLKPKDKDCCVFCSYGSIDCPSKKQE